MGSKKTFKNIETPGVPTATAFLSGFNAADYLEPAPDLWRPDQPERKSKRLNLLLKPSLFEDLRKIAKVHDTSVNDLINTVLEAYTGDHAEDIEKYEEYKELCEREDKKQ